MLNAGFYGLTYTKQPRRKNYVDLPAGAPAFALRNLANGCQYLLVRTFQRDPKTALKSRAFYDSVRALLTAPNLLVDLRNNAGGSEKEARNYVKLLKRYNRRNNLYLLLNNETISQAEIFTLAFKGRNRVTTLGQTTKGMLSYGSNYGRTHKLPSGQFVIYPTDMKGNARLLPYEGYGITPDVLLSSDADWISQAIAFIRSRAQ